MGGVLVSRGNESVDGSLGEFSLLSNLSSFCAGFMSLLSRSSGEVTGDSSFFSSSLSCTVFCDSPSDSSPWEEYTICLGLRNLCSQLPVRLLPPPPPPLPPVSSPPLLSPAHSLTVSTAGGLQDERLSRPTAFSLIVCCACFVSREARLFSVVSCGTGTTASSAVSDFPNCLCCFSLVLLPLRRLSNEFVKASLARSSFDRRGGFRGWVVLLRAGVEVSEGVWLVLIGCICSSCFFWRCSLIRDTSTTN